MAINLPFRDGSYELVRVDKFTRELVVQNSAGNIFSLEFTGLSGGAKIVSMNSEYEVFVRGIWKPHITLVRNGQTVCAINQAVLGWNGKAEVLFQGVKYALRRRGMRQYVLSLNGVDLLVFTQKLIKNQWWPRAIGDIEVQKEIFSIPESETLFAGFVYMIHSAFSL